MGALNRSKMADSQAYFDKHSVEQMMDGLVKEMAKAQPADPKAWLAAQLASAPAAAAPAVVAPVDGPPLWSLLAAKGFAVRRETNPELNPPNNKPIGHHTHNLLVKDKKSKAAFMVSSPQACDVNLKEAAKQLGQKEFRLHSDSQSVTGVEKGCITPLSMIAAGDKATLAIDESLLELPLLLMCAGCSDPLDHSQHNVVEIPPAALLQQLAEAGTAVVSLQTGKPIAAPAEAAASAPAADAGASVEAAAAKEAAEEKSFLKKQLDAATGEIVKIEKNDKTHKTHDFAHKVTYLKQHGTPMLERLITALPASKFLTTLYVGNNNLGDAGAQSVANALSGNKVLQHLYMQYNNIANAGVQAIAGYLADPECSLSSLYIYGNCVACAGAVALGEALKTNTKLEKLTLTQNYIGAAGGEGLVGALASNSKLQMLALGMNPVGDRTAIAVAKLIQDNTTALVHVQLAGCAVGDEGTNALAASLTSSETSIRVLDLSASKKIGAESKKRLYEAAESVRTNQVQVKVQIN